MVSKCSSGSPIRVLQLGKGGALNKLLTKHQKTFVLSSFNHTFMNKLNLTEELFIVFLRGGMYWKIDPQSPRDFPVFVFCCIFFYPTTIILQDQSFSFSFSSVTLRGPPSISGTESRIIKPLVAKRPGKKI